MAPELFRLEPATPAGDIYALGVARLRVADEIAARWTYRNARQPCSTAVATLGHRHRPSSTRRSCGFSNLSTRRDAPCRLDRPSRQLPGADRAARIAGMARHVNCRGAAPARRARRFVPDLARRSGAAPPTRSAGAIDCRRSIRDRSAAAAASRHSPDRAGRSDVDADVRPLALRADEFGDTAQPRVRCRSASHRRRPAAAAGVVTLGAVRPAGRASCGQLTLGALSTVAGAVIGPECLPASSPHFLGSERARCTLRLRQPRLRRRRRYPACSAALSRRRGPAASQPGRHARHRPPAQRRARSRSGHASTTRSTTPDSSRVPWHDVARLADTHPETFRDRLVLVGGEFTGSGDEHRPTPGRSSGGRPVSGLVVQAFIVNTILDGFPIREARRWPMIAGVCLASAVLAFIVLTRRRLVPVMTLGHRTHRDVCCGSLCSVRCGTDCLASRRPDSRRGPVVRRRLADPRSVGRASGKGVTDVMILRSRDRRGVAAAAATAGRATSAPARRDRFSHQGQRLDRPKAGARQLLTLYDWIRRDGVVDVAAQARLELIMIDGRRYALAGGARARLSIVVADDAARVGHPGTRDAALVSLAPIAGEAPSRPAP